MRVVAIDVGQSGSRARSSGGLDFRTGPAFDPGNGIVDNVRQVIAAAGTPEADVLALSLTGLRGTVPEPREIGEACSQMTGATSVAVADDGFAAHAGALGLTDGVVLAVGSGTVAVSRCDDGVAHRDGDGALLGDDGSGFWIGREGLRAALRDHEGRGPSTALTHALDSRFGSLHHAVRTQPERELMRWCIEAAQTVLITAAAGDDVAQEIRATAAGLLAATAAAAWRAVSTDDRPASVSFTGGVLADREFRELLATRLADVMPEAIVKDPIGDNLDGALVIASSVLRDLPPLLRWWHR